MTQDQLMGIVRVLLQVFGTIATMLGWVTPDQVGEMTANILAAVGPIMNVVGLVWTAMANSKTSILTSAARMPEVKEVVLTKKPDADSSKDSVASLLKATPDNVVMK